MKQAVTAGRSWTGSETRHDKYLSDSDHLNDSLIEFEYRDVAPRTHALDNGHRELFAQMFGDAFVGALEGRPDDRAWIMEDDVGRLPSNLLASVLGFDIHAIRAKVEAGDYDLTDMRKRLRNRHVGNVSHTMEVAPNPRGGNGTPYNNRYTA